MSNLEQAREIKDLFQKAEAAEARALAKAKACAQDKAKYRTTLDVLFELDPDLEAALDGAAPRAVEVATQGKSQHSIADRIMLTMRGDGRVWWTANELQQAISENGGEVKMTSISPNLTRLKSTGAIVRDDLKVALASRVERSEEAEAPEGDMLSGIPSEASNHTRPYQSGEPPAQGREAVPGGGT